MFCRHCGKEVEEGVRFCKYCGTRIKEEKANISKTSVRLSGLGIIGLICLLLGVGIVITGIFFQGTAGYDWRGGIIMIGTKRL